MQKLNNRFTQVLVLGAAIGTAFGIAPAHAQGGFGTDGAQQVLDNCPAKLRNPQKCDPNADVVNTVTSIDNAGLQGSVNFIPAGDPGGFILQGTGQRDDNGEPLINIDFEPPVQQGFGEMFTVNAGSNSDFRAYLGWTGTIKDLRTTGTNGVPFPSPSNPRIRDFIRVDQAAPSGNGIVDGVATTGFAADLVYTSDVSIADIRGQSGLSFDWEMQVYKLDANDERIEEQLFTELPDESSITTVLANTFVGGISASFPFSGDDLRSAIDGNSEILSGFGYDITLNSTPDTRIIPEAIPEPTTILSSLLLFGGGALKLKKRNRA
jgi:hypothetical protein